MEWKVLNKFEEEPKDMRGKIEKDNNKKVQFFYDETCNEDE